MSASPDCEGFADEDQLSIEVVINNETSQTIYVAAPLGSCAAPEFFDALDSDDKSLHTSTMCRNSCARLRSTDVPYCEPLCDGDRALTLESGASLRTTWNGTTDVRVTLPRSCRAAGLGETTCSRLERFSAGSYTFVAQAGTELTCPHVAGGCSECIPTDDGTCQSELAKTSGTALSAQRALDLDPEAGLPDQPIELVSGSASVLADRIVPPGEHSVPRAWTFAGVRSAINTSALRAPSRVSHHEVNCHETLARRSPLARRRNRSR